MREEREAERLFAELREEQNLLSPAPCNPQCQVSLQQVWTNEYQLQCRPDLAKGLRARGQFHVARLLGKYAASEQDSPAPFPPPGFPQPPSPPSQSSSQAGLAAPPQDGVPIGAPLRPASENSIPPQSAQFAANVESQPKIPSSIFDQLEADAQRAASRGDRSARGGARGIPLPARDSQATTEAVERLRQLGSAPGIR